MSDAIKAAALELIARGYGVVVLEPGGKRPIEARWNERPITDPADLERRWRPGANVGVIPDPGMVVIDVDAKGGGKPGPATLAALERELGDLGRPDQVTPSLGMHYAFRLPAGATHADLPNGSEIWPGIDVLTAGRQFVAAPSVVGGRAYEAVWAAATLAPRDELRELPPAWLAWLRGAHVARSRAPSNSPTLHAPDLASYESLMAGLANAADTSRDVQVAVAHMCYGAVGEAGEDAFLAWSARWDGPVDPAHDRALYRSLNPRNVRTGWRELQEFASGRTSAREEEWGDLPPPGPSPAVPVPGTIVLDSRIENVAAPAVSLHDDLLALRDRLASVADPDRRASARAVGVSRVARHHDVAAREVDRLLENAGRAGAVPVWDAMPDVLASLARPPLPAIVRPYVFREGQHALYGAPGSYKTFLALDWAMHAASGLPWLGDAPVERVPVAVYAGEGVASIHQRVLGWACARGLTPDALAALRVDVRRGVPRLGHRDGIVERAAEELRARGVGLLVIDNATRLMAAAGLDSTKPGEFGRVLGDLDELAQLSGASVLTIHHSPASNADKPAGTYQVAGDADVVMRLARPEGTDLLARLEVRKTRATASPPPLDLALEFVDYATWAGTAGLEFVTGRFEDEHRTLAIAGRSGVTRENDDGQESNGALVRRLLAEGGRQNVGQLRRKWTRRGAFLTASLAALEREGEIASRQGNRGAVEYELTPVGLAAYRQGT